MLPLIRIIKAMGALITLISCGSIGLILARNYRVRPKELKELYGALQILETEIAYSLTTLPCALEKVAACGHPPVSYIFKLTGDLLVSGQGYTPSEAWDKALEECFDKLALNSWDRELLSSFGKSLGASDREDQVRHIRALSEELSRESIAAKEEMEKNFKVWAYLGFLGGLGLVLLIY